MGEENGVNGNNTKKIKFAKRSTSSSDNNLSNNSNNGNNFTTGNESVTSAMTFDKQSTATRIGGVSGLFGFLFSPAGIVLMFVAVNYPWLKTLIVGSSTSLFPSTSPSSFSSSSPVMMNTKSTTSPSSAPTTTTSKKTGGSNANKNEADLLLQNLSPGCKNNPFKRIFDRTCRQEIKQLRIAQKHEKMKERKERQERRKRRQQQQQLYPQTPANATVTAADDDITDFGSSNNGYHRTITTTTTGTSSSQQIKIVNINTLECNNILSRECRQKKRLMQQMKEALN